MPASDRLSDPLQREWAIGLAVVLGVFALALAAALVLTFARPSAARVPDLTATPEPQAAIAELPLDPQTVCRTALANAKKLGALPAGASLSDPDPRMTDRDGRYICDAGAAAIAFDMRCGEAGNASCVALHMIFRADGTVLYQN